MPVKVYIWEYRKKDALGHASLTLSDGTHISWWPEKGIEKSVGNLLTKRNISKPARENQTLADDIQCEEIKKPTKYVVKNVNEAEIAKWWKVFKQTNKDWHYSKMNCSTVVYLALRAGNLKDYAQFDWVPIWIPNWIEWIIEATAKQLETQVVPDIRSSLAQLNWDDSLRLQ